MKPRMSTVQLEDLVAAWHRHRGHSGVRGRLGTREIEHVIAARLRYLLEHGDVLLAEGRRMRLLDAYDSVASGGSRLHVPLEAREESVSNWLAWVLRADVITDAELRSRVISNLFTHALANDAMSLAPAYSVEEEYPIPLLPGAYASTGYLDLVVRSSTATIVIEVKVGDLHIEKNADYRRALEQGDLGWPNIACMLLIPGSDLVRLRSGEAEVMAGLDAFPNTTWESFLGALRATSALYANEPREKGVDAWRAVVAVFTGFIEATVLGFRVDRIRQLIEGGVLLSARRLDELNSYVQYRREHDVGPRHVSR